MLFSIPWQIKLAGVGILLAAGIGSGIWIKATVDENRALKTKLANSVAYIDRAEKMAKEINEVSDGYQKKITAADARTAALVKQLHNMPKGCPAANSGGSGSATEDYRLYWENEQAPRDALDLANAADKQTEQLIACQKARKLRVCN